MMENSAPIDRISNLPNEILSHILSLLPTKFAFATTVLSKRWGLLDRLFTTLHFDDESVVDIDAFLRYCSFVKTVMLATHLIKTFRLECGTRHWKQGNRFNNVDSWIQMAKQHPVENIQISALIYLRVFLPPSFFRFPILVVLKLCRVRVVDNIYVDLPLLNTLHLSGVYLKNMENFNKLLNGCPVLEDLNVYVHYIEASEKSVTVRTRDVKTLSKLIRAKINECDVPFRAIPNVEVLNLSMFGILPEPEINSYFKGFLVCQNLIHLELYFYIFHHMDNVVEWDNLVVVLENCPKLQILVIEKWTVDRDLLWKYPNFVPECISSHLRSCSLHCKGHVDELRFAKYILQNAPLLGVMKIKIIDEVTALTNQDALEELYFCPRISPKCKLSIVGSG